MAMSFRVFKGIESDILADGCLDYPDEILSRFDFVVASVHGQFRKDRASQTERTSRALSKPHTTNSGHMTGRQLLRRPGYDVDVEHILQPVPSMALRWKSMPTPGDWIWIGGGTKRL